MARSKPPPRIASDEPVTPDDAAHRVPEATDESTSTPEDGLGSVEGDEVEAAEADAAEVHDAALEGTATAEAAATDVATEEPPTAEGAAAVNGDAADGGAEPAPVPAQKKPTITPQVPAATPRRRWWRRK